ncbi:hypothetical protein BU24DRAFT_489872 [Aaosphaeria arxii CBS 175.79]|uniref:Sensitive to high expression protein 9, mitochondrial n=1 Tax=Aaosphaeria arxii CBS 175.79 TaxID=1450172 RepID=A0A6A5Y428_9PLEO|nr:uncharacterized protein BU24DRAFT_489872 [Aaosphaeria arxii CBS 175.79]KAF2020029.1 hypothetical protein BU24DRAFT_489872 [Aaosphaeria arxii CBS 175.79]
MRTLLQHAPRTLLAGGLVNATQHARFATFRSFAKVSKTEACLRCQLRTAPAWTPGLQLSGKTSSNRLLRQFSSSRRLLEDKKDPNASEPIPETIITPPPPSSQPLQHQPHQTIQEPIIADSDQPPPAAGAAKPSGPTPNPPKPEEPISRVPDEDLPSHREKQRWDLSKRVTEIMDDVLPKLAVVTQKVNTYTGTDYSSISALRKEIQDQEKLVRSRRQAIDEAKQALDAAHAQQAAAQKEVVALLERKHSWSATDLERYMSLIRSEHVNDQAVREGKDAVINAENALEEARTQLEKRERAQYHEEQIWSDTIRRNSTWVTFGLMGFNILLLLTSLVFLEPWRRRRMVREIKAALEEQKIAMEAAAVPLPVAPIEIAIDEVIEPAGQRLEDIVKAAPAVSSIPSIPIPAVELHSSNPEVDPPIEAPKSEQPVVANPVPEPFSQPPTTEEPLPATSIEAPEKVAQIDIASELNEASTWHEKLTTRAQNLMSDRPISMRQRDFTNAVLEAAAVGAVVTGVFLQVVFRSR